MPGMEKKMEEFKSAGLDRRFHPSG